MRCLAPRSAERGDAPSPCSLIGWAISQQYPERQEWPDRNELLVHEVFLRERQAFHEGSRPRPVLAVQQEDYALAVAAREPLLNFAVEIQGNGRTNFGGHDFHDLLDRNPRYLDGKIQQWFTRGDGKGVIFLLNCKDVAEARALIESLPLPKENLMDEQFIPVAPLLPLGILLRESPAN